MVAKRIYFADNARVRLLRGVDVPAETVQVGRRCDKVHSLRRAAVRARREGELVGDEEVSSSEKEATADAVRAARRSGDLGNDG